MREYEQLGDTYTVTLYPCVQTEYGWVMIKDRHPREFPGDEYALIGDPVEVTFNINRDPREDMVASLRQQIQTVRAKSEQQVKRLEDKITRLLALEHKEHKETA